MSGTAMHFSPAGGTSTTGNTRTTQPTTPIVWQPASVNTQPPSVCVAAGGEHSASITEHGRVLHWGRALEPAATHHCTPQQLEPAPPHATHVALGWHHAVMLDAGGCVWTAGSNRHGQRGPVDARGMLPATAFGGGRVVHVAAGSEHSLSVDAGGGVWAWGWGEHGMLGDGSTTDRGAPTLVARGLRGGRVAAGAGFSVAWGSRGVDARGDVECH